jgi:hypothetical protein
MTIKAADLQDAKKQDTKKNVEIDHPGMMGDGTEEQNLGERGNPAARITKEDVDAAFGAHQRPSSETTHEEQRKDNDNNKP